MNKKLKNLGLKNGTKIYMRFENSDQEIRDILGMTSPEPVAISEPATEVDTSSADNL